MGVFYGISPKNSSFTKNDIKQQIYNNFYNIFSPQIKNNINISDVEKVKDIDMMSINVDDNNNIKLNSILNNPNTINIEQKKSFSAFKENKSYNNTVTSDNEGSLRKNDKKITDNLIAENKKLNEKVYNSFIINTFFSFFLNYKFLKKLNFKIKLNAIKLENVKLKEENEKLKLFGINISNN